MTRTSPDLTALAREPHQMLADLHSAFQIADPKPGPATLDFERARMRMALVEEEFCELLDAYYGPKVGQAVRETIEASTLSMDEGVRDIVGVADALGDLVVVEYGYARESNIPLPAVLAEIHRANLSKLDESGHPVLRADGKFLKSDLYEPPNVARVLACAAAAATGHPVAFKRGDSRSDA